MKRVPLTIFIIGAVILCISYSIRFFSVYHIPSIFFDDVIFNTMHPYVLGWGLVALGWTGLLIERLIVALKPKD